MKKLCLKIFLSILVVLISIFCHKYNTRVLKIQKISQMNYIINLSNSNYLNSIDLLKNSLHFDGSGYLFSNETIPDTLKSELTLSLFSKNFSLVPKTQDKSSLSSNSNKSQNSSDSNKSQSSSNSNNQSSSIRTYNFTDGELKGITAMCAMENGYTSDGIRAEASLMANLYEKNRSGPWTTEGFVNYIVNGGWFATSSYYSTSANVDSDYLEAVRDVLVNGNRFFPTYIDEHDCFSDINSATNNGSAINKKDRSAYIKDVTIIKNRYGSTYTFYCFPDQYSDPFGYIDINTNQ